MIIESHKKQIENAEQAKAFLVSLITDYKLNAHPDDPFSDYVDENGNAIFTEEESEILTERMNECFDILGDEVYEIGAEELFKRIEENQKLNSNESVISMFR